MGVVVAFTYKVQLSCWIGRIGISPRSSLMDCKLPAVVDYQVLAYCCSNPLLLHTCCNPQTNTHTHARTHIHTHTRPPARLRPRAHAQDAGHTHASTHTWSPPGHAGVQLTAGGREGRELGLLGAAHIKRLRAVEHGRGDLLNAVHHGTAPGRLGGCRSAAIQSGCGVGEGQGGGGLEGCR